MGMRVNIRIASVAWLAVFTRNSHFLPPWAPADYIRQPADHGGHVCILGSPAIGSVRLGWPLDGLRLTPYHPNVPNVDSHSGHKSPLMEPRFRMVCAGRGNPPIFRMGGGRIRPEAEWPGRVPAESAQTPNRPGVPQKNSPRSRMVRAGPEGILPDSEWSGVVPQGIRPHFEWSGRFQGNSSRIGNILLYTKHTTNECHYNVIQINIHEHTNQCQLFNKFVSNTHHTCENK